MQSSSMKEAQENKEKVLKVASWEATKWGIGAGVVVGGLTLLGHHRSKKFNQYLSLSAKVSFPVMAALGFWSYRYERVAYLAKMNPEEWGIGEKAQQYQQQQQLLHATPYNTMPLHHKVINFMYDHPFQMISGLGIPLTASILYQQKHNTHLTLSQKIMHSRVFAQAGVLSILLSFMAFREYMDRHGRFPDPEAELAVEHNEN